MLEEMPGSPIESTTRRKLGTDVLLSAVWMGVVLLFGRFLLHALLTTEQLLRLLEFSR